jgi:hypothetical protein
MQQLCKQQAIQVTHAGELSGGMSNAHAAAAAAALQKGPCFHNPRIHFKKQHFPTQPTCPQWMFDTSTTSCAGCASTQPGLLLLL